MPAWFRCLPYGNPRALGIPAVMGLGRRNIASLEGRRIIVDGYQGRVFVDPPPAVIHQYERLAREEAELSVGLLNLRDLPAVTTDGVKVSLGATSACSPTSTLLRNLA